MASEPAHVTDITLELPGYRVLRQLGRGNMGVVYLAEDVHLRRQVALKVLAPALVDHELFRQRFDRESHNAATLDHPNIIPVYATGEAAGARYITMRYVAGGDLRALLETNGPLSLEQATSIIVAVADALDAAHAQGIVHRDVKPANILVDGRNGQEHYYLSDFGIAKGVSSAGSLTSTGQIMGTIDYLAPEQVQGKPVDGQADLYALGCVLYHCLTGAVPFPREDIAALMWAHVHEEPPSVTARRPDLPLGLDHIVAKAMAKQPTDRYPTGRELVVALRAVTADPAACVNSGEVSTGIPISSPPPPVLSAGMTGTYTALVSAPARAPGTASPPRRRWWLLAASGVLALALIAGSTVAVVKYLDSRYPNETERALLDQLPRVLVDSCQRNAGQDPTNVKASVTCTSGGNLFSVVFTKFASPQALDDRYHAHRTTARIDQDSGDCRNAEFTEGPYTSEPKRKSQTSGRVFCYQDRGASSIEWTEMNSQTLGLATQADSNYQNLWKWWADVVGVTPPTLPAAELAQSSPSPRLPLEAAGTRHGTEADMTEPPAKTEWTKKQPVQLPSNPATTSSNPTPTPATPTPTPATPAATLNAPNTDVSRPTSTPPPSAPSATSVKLDSPTPDEPDPRQVGAPEPGTDGCTVYDPSAYKCSITRAAPFYLAGTTYPRYSMNAPWYLFLCQSEGPQYSDKKSATHWWAWVLLRNHSQGWVPVVFLNGALDDKPESGLPVCGKTPTTTSSQSTGP